jgi:myo-inositol 2-dehydrogenase / D-chiro-inositol 1-dehydrogenase
LLLKDFNRETAQPPRVMDNLRFGLVGYGRFGKLHAAAISSVPGVELTCVCVGQATSVADAKQRLGLGEVYSDYDEFLEKGRMDVVSIVSPNYLHSAHAVKAMRSGKDVLLEKPVATSMEEARKILEERDRSSAVVHVGFEGRYTPFIRAFKSSLEDGSISDPTFAKIESWRAPFRPGAANWRYDKTKVGHQLLEEAIHHFDAAAWFFGVPKTVSGFTDSPGTWEDGVVSTAAAVLEYPSLKVVVLDCLRGLSEHVLVEVCGQGAMIGLTESELNGPAASSWIKKKDKTGKASLQQPKVLSETENLVLETADFAERLRSGKEPSITLEDGVRALSIDLAAIEAIGFGTRVTPTLA